jgi:hypothetical protein
VTRSRLEFIAFGWAPRRRCTATAWAAYLAVFVPSTILNIAGHRGDDRVE